MSDPQSVPATPVFHTIPETAKQLKVSPKTVRRWITDGRLKAHRFGKQIRVSDPDLLDFAERCRQ